MRSVIWWIPVVLPCWNRVHIALVFTERWLVVLSGLIETCDITGNRTAVNAFSSNRNKCGIKHGYFEISDGGEDTSWRVLLVF